MLTPFCSEKITSPSPQPSTPHWGERGKGEPIESLMVTQPGDITYSLSTPLGEGLGWGQNNLMQFPYRKLLGRGDYVIEGEIFRDIIGRLP